MSEQSSAMRDLLISILTFLADLHRRMLAVYFAVAGPRVAYWFTGALGKLLYRLLDPLRLRSEAQCRAAIGNVVDADQIAHIAEKAFVHRIWDLTDLYLADRLLHQGTYTRYGGRVPEPSLRQLLDAQQRGQPAILLTGYYGPFDLLPLFLGFNGVRACAVYLPHRNAEFDAYRRRIRSRSGCEMIPVGRAADRLAAVLESGGSVAIIADHDAGPKGLPDTFLGLPTRVMKSVGLLAWQYKADVVVAGIRRVHERFQFEIVVEDIIFNTEWAQQDNPVTHITSRYLRGLERIILADPTQYLWAYPRWGKEFAKELTQAS